MPASTKPIEIVGGGLAGLSLGIALRSAGVPVVLHEAGDYPRHRVCGEFITGLNDTTIGRLGLRETLADALLHRTVAWFSRGEFVREQVLPQPALGLSRHQLDARLAAIFEAQGGTLHTKSRRDSTASTEGRVLAVGRRPAVSEWLGLKIHVRGYMPRCDLELHLGEHAYLGVAGIEGGEFNLCGLFRRRPELAPPKGRSGRVDFLLGYLEGSGLGALAEILRAQADFDADSFCAVAGVDFRAVPFAPAQLRLGDAHAMIPPFTGNGMAIAFQSAELALDPLLAYCRDQRSWTETCRLVHEQLRRHFCVRLKTANLLHPFLHAPVGQNWLRAASRLHLLPMRPLYSLLH